MGGRTTRRPSGSLAFRLLAVVLVPIAAVVGLGVERMDHAGEDAAAARDLADEARLRQALSAVYGPANLERIAAEGLARIDAFGIPRDLVVEFSGFSFEFYDRTLMDEALDDLRTDHADVRLPDGETLGSHVADFQAALSEVRTQSDARSATTEGVAATFGELDELLAAAFEVATPPHTTGGGPDPRASDDRAALVALGTVSTEAAHRGNALIDTLLAPSPDTVHAVIECTGRLRASLDALRVALPAEEIAAFDELIAALPEVPDEVLVESPTTGTIDLDPAVIQVKSAAIVENIVWLQSLSAYSDDVHARVVERLEASVDAADQAASDTRVWVGAIAVVSLLLLAVVLWSIVRPLRRLTRHAHRIGEGDLTVDPLPVRGPGDIRTLTRTVNAMAGTLNGVEKSVRRLAGHGHADEPLPELPGSIGISLAASFQHLQTVTDDLRASRELASEIVAQAADAIWTLDAAGLIRSANGASERLLGIPADEQIDTPLRLHLDALSGQTVVRHVDGTERGVLVASSRIGTDGEPIIAVIAHDISERLRFEERLHYQARHDALTGLPNRFEILDHLATHAIDSRTAVLFLDLDGFKSVNDAQGHAAGDRVLEAVAHRLSRVVRPHDLVGRIGGDEFVIVMSSYTDADDVIGFAQRMIAEIEQPFRHGDEMFALSASIGVTLLERGLAHLDLTPLEAIQQADSAVYLAKDRGRGRVELFDSDLQAALLRAADIEVALRRAIPNRELELYLQPVYDVRTGSFRMAEALVRWNRPGVGMVPPGDFIGVAERSSLIFDIERWVLGEACERLAVWRSESPGSPLRIAVNISGRHLVDGNLLADIEHALAITGADPRDLEIEITETQLMDDLERATHVLDRVRSLGISIAVDDFGVGYSSIAYLRGLPIDVLKIDQSFVRGADVDTFDSTVLEAITTIGRTLGVTIVAEGVETARQMQYLVDLGTDRLQGFHLARPQPIGDAEDVIRASRPGSDRRTVAAHDHR